MEDVRPSFDDARPVSVVLASTARDWHGGEEQLLQLARGLRQRGHRCHVFARRRTACAERLACDDFPVDTFAGTGCDPLSISRLRSRLKRLSPDVLHFNDANALTSAGIASIHLKIPVRIVSRRVVFPIRSIWRYNALADRVLCVSTAVAKVCQEGGVHPQAIEIVHDGGDPSRATLGDRVRGRRTLGCLDEETLLLCVAKLTEHKGHCYLLEAMSRVAQHHPRAILVLAGDGELAEPLKRQAKSLGLINHVRFLGYRQDIADLMAASDLFVVASDMEGLCSSIIDAMLAARSIVATRAGGIPDLMGETFCPEAPVGWTCPAQDPQALAEAMIAALSAPEQERRLRQERAKRRAERLFTAETMVQRTLQVYTEVLNAKETRRSATPNAA